MSVDVLDKIMALARAEKKRLVAEAKTDDGLAALRAIWKRSNGRLTQAGIDERHRLQKLGLSTYDIARRLRIHPTAAGYKPLRQA